MAFLSEVADHLLTHFPERIGDCTVVFPNRRAGLFLKKHLSAKAGKTMWAPETLSLEDFLFGFSDIHKADSLVLIFELYEAFKTHQGRAESFESFFFWGEMLLRDFEEVDHYLVDSSQLFKYVKDDRQLAEEFYFLSEEQEKIIKQFWADFLPQSTKTQEQFVETWRILNDVYASFKKRIHQQNIGYTSHIYRQLIKELDSITYNQKPLIFAGFNALTPVEELLIKHFIQEHHAQVLWDIDSYYMDDIQEAGSFLRKYRKDPVFAPSFPKRLPEKINSPKELEATGVSLEIGQAKLMGEELDRLLHAGVATEDIVIVLPQEYMLFPVLNAIPDSVEQLNVTMGYPLKDTSLFGLLESVLELQEQSSISAMNGLSFYYKPALDILNHPYLYKEDKNPLEKLIHEIKKKNQIRVFQQDIAKLDSTLLNAIFRSIGNSESIAYYLIEILKLLSGHVIERFGLEREYLYHFQQLLFRLDDLLAKQPLSLDVKTFKSLFRKTARSIKIPFNGEPVNGLQVMGVLETRNLDFKHVFMLNMNENIFPASQRNGSFIPYRIRKAFELPTFETQDSIYAYLFYRLLQYPERLSFYYNSYADFGLSGEMSRFIRQLDLESDLEVKWRRLSNTIHVKEVKSICIETTSEVLNRLAIYTNQVPERDQRRLSASALNTYLDCQLRFYFRYVLRLFSGDEMSDDLNARHFGNALHKALEFIYLDNMQEKNSRLIEESDFFRLDNSIKGAIQKAFKEEFGLSDAKRFEFKDRNAVMGEIIDRFIRKVVKMDKAYAPFKIISLEAEDKYEKFLKVDVNEGTLKVKLGADIDRVDEKDGLVRVLDYKTGKDETEIGSFDNLFNPEVAPKYKYGRKAGYQTFFYAWLYAAKYGQDHPIVPGLINTKQFFKPDFDYRLKINNTPIEDARAYLPLFEESLTELLREIFNRQIPFMQTADLTKCSYCDYKGICSR